MSEQETEELRKLWLEKLEHKTHAELAHLWRFSPIGSFIFTDEKVYKKFKERFDSFGGWTPSISKTVGWDH